MIYFEIVLLMFFLLLRQRRRQRRVLLLENLLVVTVTLFGIFLGEFWQGRVWEAKKVCVIE